MPPLQELVSKIRPGGWMALHPEPWTLHPGGRLGERTRRVRVQLAQEKPLGQLDGDEHATSGADEVLAKVEIWRSTFSLSQFKQVTSSADAPTFCRRANPLPQSLHRYS